jgi:hypothetical protein
MHLRTATHKPVFPRSGTTFAEYVPDLEGYDDEGEGVLLPLMPDA